MASARRASSASISPYACGNLGQAAFYNAMSTYFIVYVTGCLFSGVDKALAAKLIGVITSLVVIIRIAEIFIDPLLGNLIDNTNTKWGRFRPWQFFGGLIFRRPARRDLQRHVRPGERQHHAVHRAVVITFVVLDDVLLPA